jgi:hypothetical protein
MRLGVSAFLESEGPAMFARNAQRQSALWDEALRLGLSPARRTSAVQVDVTVEGSGEQVLGLLGELAGRGETGFVAEVSRETSDADLNALWELYGARPGASYGLYAIVRDES